MAQSHIACRARIRLSRQLARSHRVRTDGSDPLPRGVLVGHADVGPSHAGQPAAALVLQRRHEVPAHVGLGSVLTFGHQDGQRGRPPHCTASCCSGPPVSPQSTCRSKPSVCAGGSGPPQPHHRAAGCVGSATACPSMLHRGGCSFAPQWQQQRQQVGQQHGWVLLEPHIRCSSRRVPGT